MGIAWKCDWCGKYYIGHAHGDVINATDAVVLRTESARNVVDAGVGYVICNECEHAVMELIKSRKSRN